MTLRAFIAKRSLYTLVLVFFVLSLNFVIFELIPGEATAVEILVGRGRLNDPEQVERLRALYGFGEPLGVRYYKYVTNLLTFQLGDSFRTGHSVTHDMLVRLPNTLVLLGASTVLSVVFGVALGVVVAHRRGTSIDTASVLTSLTTFSLPTFWMGLVFLLVFSYVLGWFPIGGVQPPVWDYKPPGIGEYIFERIRYAFLPVLTLTLFQYGFYTLLTRATMIEVLTEDYITTARAKGLAERTVLYKHALKNASLPLITSGALAFASIISGAIITETVFNWPGIGLWTFQSIDWKDVPVLQGVFYITALGVIIANFIADIIYGVIDPRIKYG